MNNKPPNKTQRMALMISSGMDALLGSILLLIGFHVVPVDVTQYGFENWHAILSGGLFFIIGVLVFAYNFSRIEE
ncbi:MAG TPA: hypothetical protein VLE49_02995 [Anaerolineales bacterium]|nr:hypothetical protein [Anaerolineales bacterium]